MSQQDSMIKLYSGRILELAGSIGLTDRLDAPDGSAMKRSPLCGSTVTVDIVLKDGRVAQFGQDVKACALGQASASVLAARVVGLSADQIQAGRDQLEAMLKSGGPTPDAPFEELEVLKPAMDFKNRHASILLAYDATLAAIDAASQKNTA